MYRPAQLHLLVHDLAAAYRSISPSTRSMMPSQTSYTYSCMTMELTGSSVAPCPAEPGTSPAVASSVTVTRQVHHGQSEIGDCDAQPLLRSMPGAR